DRRLHPRAAVEPACAEVGFECAGSSEAWRDSFAGDEPLSPRERGRGEGSGRGGFIRQCRTLIRRSAPPSPGGRRESRIFAMNAWLPRTFAQWFALLIGIAALVACALLGWWGDPKQTMLSWLFAFFFFTGLSVGSLALLMTHSLTGGAWGWCIRAPLLAAARLLPLMAAAAIPVLVEMRVLYPYRGRADCAGASARLVSRRHVFHCPHRGVLLSVDRLADRLHAQHGRSRNRAPH